MIWHVSCSQDICVLAVILSDLVRLYTGWPSEGSVLQLTRYSSGHWWESEDAGEGKSDGTGQQIQTVVMIALLVRENHRSQNFPVFSCYMRAAEVFAR